MIFVKGLPGVRIRSTKRMSNTFEKIYSRLCVDLLSNSAEAVRRIVYWDGNRPEAVARFARIRLPNVGANTLWKGPMNLLSEKIKCGNSFAARILVFLRPGRGDVPPQMPNDGANVLAPLSLKVMEQ